MSITLTDLKNDKREITVAYAGKDVSITYRPGAITPERRDQLASFTRDEEAGWATCEWLSEVLVAWDVLEKADGDAVPITPDSLYEMPDPFLMAILDEIRIDNAVGDETRKNSGAGSRRRVKSGNRRRGSFS